MVRAIRKITFSVSLLLIVFALVTLAPGQSGGTSQGDKNAGHKYDKLISYDVNPSKRSPEALKRQAERIKKNGSTISITPLLDIDDVPGSFYTDFNWVWKGTSKGYLDAEEHFHDYNEVIGLIGSKGEKDARDLGGEVEVWLGGEKYLITKSCLIFVPKGLKHIPIRFNRVDNAPILFFAVGQTTTAAYSRTDTKFTEAKAAERNYAKYISYDVNPSKVSPEAVKKEMLEDKKIGNTVKGFHLLDLDRVPGAFYTDFAWLWGGGSAKGYNVVEHSHDFDEVIGFIGTKGGQKAPHDLGGEMEVYLGGEKHLITKSCLIFVPKGTKHCPIRFNRVDAPILFFTMGMAGAYSSTPSYDFVTGHTPNK